jgi:hypothetical protein
VSYKSLLRARCSSPFSHRAFNNGQRASHLVASSRFTDRRQQQGTHLHVRRATSRDGRGVRLTRVLSLAKLASTDQRVMSVEVV